MFIESFINNTRCDWAQEFSMFDDVAVKNDYVFEENIDALATDKKVVRALQSPVCIKEREDSASVIDSITGLQRLLQTLVETEEAVNALNVINPIDDPTRNDIQLKLTLKTQTQFIDLFVQKVSGVIQGVVALSDKDNKNSNTFEMALEDLKISHERMKGSIGEIIHLLPADS